MFAAVVHPDVLPVPRFFVGPLTLRQTWEVADTERRLLVRAAATDLAAWSGEAAVQHFVRSHAATQSACARMIDLLMSDIRPLWCPEEADNPCARLWAPNCGGIGPIPFPVQ